MLLRTLYQRMSLVMSSSDSLSGLMLSSLQVFLLVLACDSLAFVLILL